MEPPRLDYTGGSNDDTGEQPLLDNVGRLYDDIGSYGQLSGETSRTVLEIHKARCTIGIEIGSPKELFRNDYGQ